MANKKVAKAGKSSPAPIEKQPQSKQQAAQDAGMFLKNDDSWSNACWTDGDLHSKERELFG